MEAKGRRGQELLHLVDEILMPCGTKAKTIRRAPDKIGNVNKSIPPVIKRAQGNNGIVFNVR